MVTAVEFRDQFLAVHARRSLGSPGRLLILFSVLLNFVFVAPLSAQLATASATIAGVVLDPSGNPAPNADVTIQNADWNLKHSLRTGPQGAFSKSLLPAGTYLVSATAPGFITAGKPVRIAVNSGSSVRVVLHLKIKGRSEKVTVSGTGPTSEGNTTPPAVDKDQPIESDRIAGLNVTYLPIRDRDFLQFGQLSANAALNQEDDSLVIGGQRPQYSRAIVDGADFTDVVNGGVSGVESSAIAFPQTAVRDFEVIQAGGPADLGESTGGLVKIATKSG